MILKTKSHLTYILMIRREKDLLEEMVEQAVREVIFRNEINVRMRDLSKPENANFRKTLDPRPRRKPKKSRFPKTLPFRIRPPRKKKQKITKICC